MRTIGPVARCAAIWGGLALAVPCGPAFPAERASNVVQNGGFEKGFAAWAPDPGQTITKSEGAAREGTACLTGEVTQPSKALILRQRVPVKAGNRYEFSAWARATNRTKLVLWVLAPGERERRLVRAWEELAPRWTRCSAPLDVSADGELELQIVAPSSHAAPAGRIWLDDVALLETEMPATLDASRGVGFNDEPALAAAEDGSVLAAWVSFRDGWESLQLARYELDGSRLAEAGRWQVLGGEGTYILGPEIVQTAAGGWLVYATESARNWDIHAVPCGSDGPGRPVALTSHPAVDVKPSAAFRDGVLWVAWESNRGGSRGVHVVSLREGKVSEPEALSDPAASAYDPSLAVLESGEVCVAWHAFRGGNADVWLRRRPEGRPWGAAQRLTRAPTIDRHATLLPHGDELWLIYENAVTERYNIGRTNRRRLIVAKVAPDGLLAPAAEGESPLAGRAEAPSASFDSSGRLWVAYLAPRLPRAGWDPRLTCLSGGTWLDPIPLSGQKGLDRRPALAIVRGRALVAHQSDDMPGSWSDLDRTLASRSDIRIASVALSTVPAPGIGKLAPLREPEEPFEAAEIRAARGEETPTPTIEYRGKTLKLFFGDLHEHTDVSVCNRLGDQSIDESYQHMRDLARHDFACTTDHGYNLSPYLWGYTAKLARIHDDRGRFLTFLAEEWTSTFEEYDAKHPYGFYGHRNLIFADLYFPRWWNARNRQTPAEVWEDLRKLDANFVHIPHQLADTGNVPTDWDFADEKAQPVAEIFQTRGSYEHAGAPREAGRTTPAGYFLQDAWARGIVIGVIASPDHGGGYGKACVYAPELTREAILEALRERRCYGTTAAKIILDVRVNGRLMGEKVAESPGSPVRVEVRVRAPGEIDRVEVCRQNRFIYTTRPDAREASFVFEDRDPLPGRSYYYVRVVQKDEEIAWSSPVWFGAE